MRLSGNEYYDETKIRLLEESTYNRDRVDAIKMKSFNTNAPNIYTVSNDDVNLAVNSIPEANVENGIPVGTVIPVSGTYTINLQENDFTSGIIYLEDKATNKLHKISEEDYTFSTPQGDINNRFVLHFGITDINDVIVTNPLNMWAYSQQLSIIGEIGEARLEVFDIQGRLMSSKIINVNGKYSEMLNLQTGVYVVRLQNSNMVKSKQIILK